MLQIVVDFIDQNILEGNHFFSFLDEFFISFEKFFDRVTIINRHIFFYGLIVTSVQGYSQADLSRVFRKFQYLWNQATR